MSKPRTVTMTKKKATYFKMHENQVVENMLDAARAKNFDDIDDLMYDYGRFLERNPEAMSVL